MADERTRGGVLVVVVAVAVCCGAAALLVAAGVLAAGNGLLGSPELTVAAAVLGFAGLWRLAVALRRTGS